jgi:sulfopyruvate decarboxylase TPP-binding subunit
MRNFIKCLIAFSLWAFYHSAHSLNALNELRMRRKKSTLSTMSLKGQYHEKIGYFIRWLRKKIKLKFLANFKKLNFTTRKKKTEKLPSLHKVWTKIEKNSKSLYAIVPLNASYGKIV